LVSAINQPEFYCIIIPVRIAFTIKLNFTGMKDIFIELKPLIFIIKKNDIKIR